MNSSCKASYILDVKNHCECLYIGGTYDLYLNQNGSKCFSCNACKNIIGKNHKRQITITPSIQQLLEICNCSKTYLEHIAYTTEDLFFFNNWIRSLLYSIWSEHNFILQKTW